MLFFLGLVAVIIGQGYVIFSDPIINQVYFLFGKVFSFRFIQRYPLNFAVFYLMFDPVLNSCKLCTVLQSLKTIHVVKVVPLIMGFVYMFDEIIAFSLKNRFIRTAYITSVMTLVLYFLFCISLLSKLVNNDSRNNVSE